MWQTLGVYGNVALDTRDLFACVIALVICTVGIFYALRINDQKACQGVAPLFHAGRANLIFLKPAPARAGSAQTALD
jgi:hypothetical protein